MRETPRVAAGGLQCAPLQSPIDPRLLGTARLEPAGPVEAGSFQTFVLTYTAGRYGIDDSGALRVCFRYAADHTKPQFTDPKALGFTVVRASNSAVLEYRYDTKGNVRPFDQAVYIKVVNGYLKEGETITVTFGDTSGGSPGMRVQTFVEDSFEFRVLVDPLATFNFQAIERQPEIAVVPGPPVRYLIVAPTRRQVGETFAIGVKGEDRWGNPSDKCRQSLRLRSDLPIRGLPEAVDLGLGTKAVRIEGLVAEGKGIAAIELVDATDTVVASQRLSFVDEAELLPFWADFHGQSEETIGTNSVNSYFRFARDCAFMDIAAHQGNDFQITPDFWHALNRLTADMNERGRFVTLPGYEWSGNTSLGGDRNVFYIGEGRPIRRSSRALLAEIEESDIEVTTAVDLFESLARDGEDAICFAHCGGRYADLSMGHDGRFETAVEVHSAWGTFEWLLHDALKLGHRVGIVCNSDGHKGRPGASYPGASSFGAIGGYTCLLMPELSREAVIDCLRLRRHYGTTGGPNGRLQLGIQCDLQAQRFDRDPKLGAGRSEPTSQLMMGDIAATEARDASLTVTVSASCGVERIDLFNGLRHLETVRNYELGNASEAHRLRLLMEGAAYRGRFRQVNWEGRATFSAVSIREVETINFFNPDQPPKVGKSDVSWELTTTGNFGGLDIWLDVTENAKVDIETTHTSLSLDLDDLGKEEIVRELDGPLPRRLRLFRLPDEPLNKNFEVLRTVKLSDGVDNAIYARVTLEDGTQAWSSPIYLFRS